MLRCGPLGKLLGNCQGVRSISSLGHSFTALQEQLGLRLEARKEQTELIVIDHVEKRDAN